MPGLIDLYEAHKEHRDKFEILAFHDTTAKDFAKLDRELVKIKQNRWRGRDLPFPILLDATGSTIKNWGITHFPTTVLIDPNGHLVGEADEAELEAKLPPLPFALRAARALDRDVTVSVTDPTLHDALERLGSEARVPIRLDEPALKEMGIAPDVPIPLKLTGSLSLRSWLELTLEAHDLTYETGTDAIVVKPRAVNAPCARPLSEPQRMCADRIKAKLDEKIGFDFKNKSLAYVAAYFEKKTDENFILDPKARKAGTLDPNTAITGSASDKPLREALTELLQSANMTYVVRNELVVITPRREQ